MGRSVLDSPNNVSDSITRQLAGTLPALPSPSSITAPLSTSAFREDSNAAALYSDQTRSQNGILDGALVSALSDPVQSEPIMTPPAEESDKNNMNVLVGGALVPGQSAQNLSRAPPKMGPGLRLPSFERLGIAAPHPDRIARAGTQTAQTVERLIHQSEEVDQGHHYATGTDISSFDCEATNVRHGVEHAESTGRAIMSPLHHYVNTITPPAEVSAPTWNMAPTVATAGMHSPSTDPGNAPQTPTEEQVASTTEAMTNLAETENAGDEETPAAAAPRLWIDDAVDALLENLRHATRTNGSLKILSHALPSTSTTGHIFSKVINAIDISNPVSPATPLTWINVFHAIPGRFNLADLPTSPPATPGPPVGGDDYFTQKIFDSAVSILDYQDAVTSLPRSPRPIVPPSSIDVSIVERYIPPSTPNEFAEMFDPVGSSILVDRLVELSADNGSLLFIYPTRTGAQTFMDYYLSPILDPLLRTMVVLNGLSSDLCISLGRMRAVLQLLEYEALRQRIAMLCARLTQGNATTQRFHGRRPNFTVSHSSKQYVKFPRSIWAREWWTKQEKTRLKETFGNRYQELPNRRGSHIDHQPHPAPGPVLLQHLLDGVAGKEGQESETPEQAIEVSVFVITRSA